jgi:gliding motility-associated-like protein
MGFRTTLFLLTSIFFLQNLAAQNAVSLQLDEQRQRIPTDVSYGENTIRVCGLIPGTTYMVVAIPRIVGDKTPMALTMTEPGLEKEAQKMSRADRPQLRQFIAVDACTEFSLQVDDSRQSGKMPIYLSVACVDCPEASAFMEKFLNQLESMGMANLSTTGGASASSLVTTLIGGNCFQVANAASVGPAQSRGTFNNGLTNIGINTGVVLCTGNVASLPGPNNASNTSANTAGFNQNSADDADLATLTNGNQWDVVKLEFDFTPTAESVSFQYVFGSEEYCEYANSNFNDVFGFFISGPGISGNQNVALLPVAGNPPVTINNVNHVDNTAFYVNNNAFNPCQNVGACCASECALDGWTTVLTATIDDLEPCETYHIKLAIADIADGALFSAVFLKANSFNAGGVVKANPTYPAGFNYVIEGCNGGFIRFIRAGGDINQPLVVNFTIGGSADPGDDYDVLPTTITIPAGATFIDMPVNVLADLIIEGQETITITLDNPCSCDLVEFTFNIQDKEPLEVELEDIDLCGVPSTTLSPNILSPGVPPLSYDWSTGDTTQTITISSPGPTTYTVTVTDACGDTSTAEATVTLEPAPTATLSGAGVFCTGQPPTVDLTLTFTGTGPWTVEIDNNGNTETLTFTNSPTTYTVSDPGTYTLVSVESSTGCPGTATGTVVLNEITVDLSVTANNPTCFGANNGSVQATASGGNGPFTYAWSNGPSGPNQTGLPPGTYTVTATNAQGCTAEETVDLTEPPQLTASTTNTGNIDCNNPTGSADLDVSGGTPDYTFNWSGGSGGQNPTFTTGGTYTVTVTDDNNCTVTSSVTITSNLTPPVAAATVPGQINCINSEITINGNGSSQGPNFTYEWNGPGLVCCETTLEPLVNAGGTYTLTVTNSDNGCTATVAVTVVENITPPIAVIAPPQEIGCNLPTLTLNGNGSSNGNGFTFEWTTNGGNFTCCTNTLNPQIDQAGTYTISVTNTNNGCTAEATVTVSGDVTPPTATIEPPAVVDCNMPELELDASGSSQGGNITYQWSAGGGGNIVSGGNTTNPTINAGGTYTITVTNTDNNCTATASVTVAANLTPPVAVATTPPPLTCQDPELTINGNGSSQGPDFTYEWTANPGNIVSGENTLNPVIDEAGSYTLVVTNNANGCTSSTTVNVTSNQDNPDADAGPDLTVNCTTPNLQLQGSGSSGNGIVIQWTANPGNITGGANTYSPTINQPGTYILVVTNTNNGCSSTDEVTIDANFDTPTAQIEPPLVVDCNNPTIEIDGSGSTQGPEITYNWTANPGNITGGGNSTNPTVNQAGTYTLVVTNTESGCTDTASVTVTSNLTPPVAVAVTPPLLTCTNPELTINGNGSSQGPDFTYEWTANPGNIVSGENTLNPVIDEAGSYTLVVTNQANGCTSSTTVNVNANQNYPDANAGPALTLNCANPNLQLQGSGSSGNGIVIAWSANPGNITGGANTYSPTINQPGTYTLVVTNTTNGCSSTDEVTIDSNFDVPTAVIAPPLVVDCNNPTIEIDGSGSSQGQEFTYNWAANPGNITGGGSSTNPTVNQAGTYTITVTNTDNGCTATSSVTVTSNLTPPVAVAATPPLLTCQNPEVTINGNGSSQGPDFTYEWTTGNGNIVSGETTLNPVVDQAGAYTLVVTNQANGCTSSTTVNVSSNQNFPNVNAGPELQLDCLHPTVQLQGSGSSGPGFTILWTANPGNIVSGANTYSPTVNQPGTYNVVVTNTANGCTNEDAVTITSNFDVPVVAIEPPLVINCYNPSIELDAGGSSQGPEYTFLWTANPGNIQSGGASPNPTVNQPGTYNLVVTNTESGCTATSSVTVTANLAQPTAIATTPGLLTCQNPEITLNGNGSSQGPDFTYEWTTNNGNIVSGETTLNPVIDQPGTYTLVVTNQDNGCTRTATVTVNSNQNFPNVSAGPEYLLNCVNPTLQLNGSGSSGPGFVIQWTANPGNIVSGANTYSPTINQPGIYYVVVTNTANGCTAEDFVQIEANFDQPVASIAPPDIVNCYTPEVELDASASTDGPDIVYTWSTANGNIIGGQGTPNLTVNQGGTYNLLVSNVVSGCTATASMTVLQNLTLPNANAGPGATLSCTISQLTLNGSGSSGPNFIYEWWTNGGSIVSGENTLNPVIDAPGQYTLMVTNTTNGCSRESTVNILADQNAPTAFAGSDAELTCTAPSVQLNGFGSTSGNGITYQWVANPGNIVSGATTLTPTVNSFGYYTLIVTNTANGCTDESEVFVDDNIVYPVASIFPAQQLNCVFETVELDAGGSSGDNLAFAWTPNNLILSGQGTENPEVGQTGTYNLVVTNTGNGCTATASVTVTQDITPPVAAAVPTASITCQSPQTTLNGSGSSDGYPFFYEWTTQNGNIVSGNLTLNPIVNQVGAYTLTVFNIENGCTAQTTVQVITQQTFPTASAGPAQTITCAAQQLNLDGSGSSQGQQYTYVWTTQNGNIVSGGNTLNPLVNAPGTYELSVVNTQTGCTSTASVSVAQNTTDPVAAVAPGGVLSCTITTLTLDGTASSTGGNFTYNWTTAAGNIVSGQGTLNPIVDATGTYSLLVTNTTNGCTTSATTTVTADASVPTASAGPATTLTCTVTQITLDGSASSQGVDFTYNWTGPGIVSGGNTLAPTINMPGAYALSITNTSNGCTASSNVVIPADVTLPIAEAGDAAVLNCVDTVLTINGNASSSGPLFVYAWTASPGGNILSGANTLMPQIDQPGTYTLLISNTSNGCTATDAVGIVQNTTLPTASAGAPGLITCTNSTVTLSGSGSTGQDFVYLWTTPNGSIASGANTLSPVVDAPGTYNLLVTNSINGCTAVSAVAVAKDANVPVAIAIAPGPLTCATTQIQLNGNGTTTGPTLQYNWSTANGNIVSGATTLNPTVNQPGQYTLNVFNSANNCEALFTVNVTQDLAAPAANAGAPAVISCANPVLTLNGSASSQGVNFTYQWSTVTGNIISGATTTAPQVDRSGNYVLVVTNTQNGCTSSASVQILLDQNSPQAEAGPQQQLTCVASSIALNGAGTSVGPNFVYQWTAAGGGNIVSGETTLNPIVNAAGQYTLLVTNPTNGCTSVDAVNVLVNVAPPVAVVATPPVLNCQLTQTALSTTGSSTGSNFTYNWTTVGGGFVSGANSPAPVVNKPGTYNLVITNTGNGCTTTASTVVTQNVLQPTTDAGITAELNCITTSLTLNGVVGNLGGSSAQYAWATSNGNIVSGSNSLNPMIDAPGIYVLTVTNLDNFCSATDQVAIAENVNLPTAAVAAAPVLTCAVPTVSLDGNGSSSGALFSYQWVAQGGGNILSGATSLLPTVNSPGTYLLTVTNNNNKCTSTASVAVTQNITPPDAVAGNTVTLTCTTPTLQLNGAGSSTGSQYSYEWSTLNGDILSGASTLQPTIGAPGLYTLLVTNATNGCTKEADVQVLQDAGAPVATAATPGELTCTVQTVPLNGTGSSVGSNFGYQWSTANGQILTGGTTLQPTVGAPGIYQLLVTNSQNGCTAIRNVTVTQNIVPPDVVTNAANTITCATTSISLSAFGTGGSQGVGYVWTTTNGNITTGANTANPTVNAGGLYNLVVTDVYNGCTNTAQVPVSTDTQAPAIAIAAPNLLTCAVVQVTLDGTASAQGSQYSYTWTGPGIVSGTSSLVPVVNQPGSYSLAIVNNLNGCTASATAAVQQNVQLPMAEAGNGFELTCSVDEGTLSSAGSSAGSGFSYLWSTQTGNILSAPTAAAPAVNAPGTYALLVTNLQTGCTSTDNVVVTENTNYPSSLNLFTEPPSCDDRKGTIRFVEVQGGVGPYLYSIDGGSTFLTANQFENLNPGQYQLVVQDVNGCEYEESLTFQVPVEPDVIFGPEISLSYGESATLTAQINIPLYQVDSIIWSPMESLILTDKPNVVIARPFTSTQYTVRVVNKEGCEDRATIIVRVSDPNLWAPNAISPNKEDGKNDVFLLFAGPNTVNKINSLQIYDRWGNQVFFKENIEPNNEKYGWDGRFRGKPMNPAVFVWWAEIELVSGQKILMKGDVTIVE